MDEAKRQVILKDFYSTIEILHEIKKYFGDINTAILKAEKEDRLFPIRIDALLKSEIIKWFDDYLNPFNSMNSALTEKEYSEFMIQRAILINQRLKENE